MWLLDFSGLRNKWESGRPKGQERSEKQSHRGVLAESGERKPPLTKAHCVTNPIRDVKRLKKVEFPLEVASNNTKRILESGATERTLVGT